MRSPAKPAPAHFAIALLLAALAACGQTEARSPPSIDDASAVALIHVDKSDRILELRDTDGAVLRRYQGIRLGNAPEGHKQFEGDEKTPEGRYAIDGRNPGSKFHLSMRVSYPNAADRAYASAKGKRPGGDIFIHGQPNGSPLDKLDYDWTDGCIALSNSEIEEIWRLVRDGTAIEIQP